MSSLLIIAYWLKWYGSEYVCVSAHVCVEVSCVENMLQVEEKLGYLGILNAYFFKLRNWDWDITLLIFGKTVVYHRVNKTLKLPKIL